MTDFPDDIFSEQENIDVDTMTRVAAPTPNPLAREAAGA